MPKENRKRGKRHKKTAGEEEVAEPEYQPVPDEPSWIRSAAPVPDNADAPFGYVDADVKAYFRTIDLKLKEWQDENPYHQPEGDEGTDRNEDRRMLLTAALSETSGKELQLATDPDCSNVLERMLHSMDDFVRRVFMDSLAGSYSKLMKHRFASHVCQTLLVLAADTASRESRGIFPPVPQDGDKGVLRTLTQLTLDVVEEISDSAASLVMDPFGSHVMRALLILLCPDIPSSRSTTSSLRSKKSATYKSRQGPMKSVLTDVKSLEGIGPSAKSVPKEFKEAAQKLIQLIRENLSENEVRAMAADKVASPALQILLEVEASCGLAHHPGSLLDHMLVGIITNQSKSPPVPTVPSDYLMTLLRDPTSSHLLETVITCSPPTIFKIIWLDYFAGKLPKLATHPVANFVLAKAIASLDANFLPECIRELNASWPKLIKEARTGVLRAIIDRAASLQSAETEVVEAVHTAFELETEEEHKMLFHCVLRLKTLPTYTQALQAQAEIHEGGSGQNRGHRNQTNRTDPSAPTTQGAILLQSLLRLSNPHNRIVLSSIESMEPRDLLAVAHDVTSSRVLDVVFESTTVPKKSKNALILAFLGHFHELVDDRIGSRVGDRCWAEADPFLREKIAKSMMPHEQFLIGSHYGKYFSRSLNLSLLRRRPDEWKALQVKSKAGTDTANGRSTVVDSKKRPNEEQKDASQQQQPESESTEPRPRKKRKKQDEIDQLFETVKPSKFGRAPTTARKDDKVEAKTVLGLGEHGLNDVFGAIKAAPKSDMRRKRKK